MLTVKVGKSTHLSVYECVCDKLLTQLCHVTSHLFTMSLFAGFIYTDFLFITKSYFWLENKNKATV